MKKFLRTFFFCMLTAVTMTVYARAAEDTLKVGLYYGDDALFSANLQNFQGSGYRLGWFDENTREFVQIGALTQEKISMTAGGTFYVSGGAYSKTRPSRVTISGGRRFSGKRRKGSQRVSWVPAVTARMMPRVCRGVRCTAVSSLPAAPPESAPWQE